MAVHERLEVCIANVPNNAINNLCSGVTPLDNLHRKLVEPFINSGKVEFDGGLLETRIASMGSPERDIAADIVNYTYTSSYLKDGGKIIDLATDEFDLLPTTHTLVASQKVDGADVVVGTFRVVCGDELEVFNLFEMERGNRWPHERVVDPAQKPGELGRFSLHPIFEDLNGLVRPEVRKVLTSYRRLILHKLWPFGIDIMKNAGITLPYFILAPHVFRFVSKSGIHPTEVEGVMPNRSFFSQDLRRRYNEYWKPDRSIEEQPAVYLAPKFVEPIKWEFNSTAISLD